MDSSRKKLTSFASQGDESAARPTSFHPAPSTVHRSVSLSPPRHQLTHTQHSSSRWLAILAPGHILPPPTSHSAHGAPRQYMDMEASGTRTPLNWVLFCGCGFSHPVTGCLPFAQIGPSSFIHGWSRAMTACFWAASRRKLDAGRRAWFDGRASA